MTVIRINGLSPQNLHLAGAEPLGAEERARTYTDQKIAQLPPAIAPTLAELGGEPVGAEARARTYTDQKIAQLPPAIAPTLTELGGEPAGAEQRAKTYTDQQISRIFALEDRLTANELKVATWVPYSLRLNCGTSSVSYLDSQGGSWLRDTYFSGGTAFDTVAQAGAQTTTQTNDPTIYRYERSTDNGTFTYTIPVAAGTYTVRLHFCENFHNGANLRVGSVRINNVTVLTSFDVWVQAGGRYRALVRNFTGIISTGSVVVSVTNTLLNGIELIRTS